VTLAKIYELENKPSHRALSDCHCVNELYSYLVAHVKHNNIDLVELLKTKINNKKTKAADISATVTEFDETHPFFGKICAFTGLLEQMKRKDAMQAVANLGGVCADSVTQKTNFLILGNNDYCKAIKDGKSSKQKKAEQMKLGGADIEIISENVFYDMLTDNQLINMVNLSK
jgi:DNA polymerase-3 subunit epsilon